MCNDKSGALSLKFMEQVWTWGGVKMEPFGSHRLTGLLLVAFYLIN